MPNQARGWLEIIASGDAEALWNKLFRLVSSHSSIRNLLGSRRNSPTRLEDLHSDLCQDLFLKLHKKDRWNHYQTAGYTDSEIEHELYHIEIPNLVSLLLRDRHPEAYRMVRRISDLLQGSSEFRLFTHSDGDPGRKSKLVTRTYGLSEWPSDKPFKPPQTFGELIKDVPPRARDRRRAGRASTTHIIISNPDLIALLVEILSTIDSPADVRVLRSLVLSKLAVEDSKFVSIDAAVVPEKSADPEPMSVDFPDKRPTPEQILLESESRSQADVVAAETLVRLRDVVRNKPKRYHLLATVVWHCYFDKSAPSQTRIARTIGISSSLVSYYRKLFDSVVRDINLDTNQFVPFLHSFSTRLKTSISSTLESQQLAFELADASSARRDAPASKHLRAAAARSHF